MLKLLLVVAIFALVTYLVTRALQERGGSGSQQVLPRPQWPTRPTRPARPVAPDDDEDFLRELERRRRRARKPPEDG